jgi:hypothetical protein
VAQQAADQRDFETCKTKASEAWTLGKDPEAEGLLGVCEVELHAYREGATHLDDALARVPGDDVRFTRWRERFADARAQVGQVDVTSSIPGCVVRVDHAEVEGAAPKTIYMYPGRHIVEGFAEGHLPQAYEVYIAGGEQKAIAFDLSPPADVVPRGRPLWPGIAGLGLGVIGVLAGAGLVARHDSLLGDTEESGKGLVCNPAKLSLACQYVSDEADAAEAVGNAGVWTMVAGGALIGAGTGLLIWGLAGNKRPPTKERTFVAIPVLDPSMGGLLVRGTF